MLPNQLKQQQALLDSPVHTSARSLMATRLQLLHDSSEQGANEPLFSRIPFDEEPVQHQGQHGHEAEVQPVIAVRGSHALPADFVVVGSLTSRTHL